MICHYIEAHFTQSHVILKVSKPARLVAAGCLVFLVYLLYSYHNLPQEGGEDGGQVVKHEHEEEDSGVPVLPAKQVSSVLTSPLIKIFTSLCYQSCPICT